MPTPSYVRRREQGRVRGGYQLRSALRAAEQRRNYVRALQSALRAFLHARRTRVYQRRRGLYSQRRRPLPETPSRGIRQPTRQVLGRASRVYSRTVRSGRWRRRLRSRRRRS